MNALEYFLFAFFLMVFSYMLGSIRGFRAGLIRMSEETLKILGVKS
jgi:hypothetical protein